MTKHYGIPVGTISNAINQLNSDLEYLSSLVENPDPEFIVADAVAYSQAVVAIASHLNFMAEDISGNSLSESGEHVKVSEDELVLMNDYMQATEDAIAILEVLCGISLQNN